MWEGVLWGWGCAYLLVTQQLLTCSPWAKVNCHWTLGSSARERQPDTNTQELTHG